MPIGVAGSCRKKGRAVLEYRLRSHIKTDIERRCQDGGCNKVTYKNSSYGKISRSLRIKKVRVGDLRLSSKNPKLFVMESFQARQRQDITLSCR